MTNYTSLDRSHTFVRLEGSNSFIDTRKLIPHQECYLMSEDNFLVSESIDGHTVVLGKIAEFKE